LVIKFAKENPTWGYDRIQGALANVGYHISDSTVGKVFKQHGIEPAPDRKRQTSWATFLKSHWDVLAPGQASRAALLLTATWYQTRKRGNYMLKNPCTFVSDKTEWRLTNENNLNN